MEGPLIFKFLFVSIKMITCTRLLPTRTSRCHSNCDGSTTASLTSHSSITTITSTVTNAALTTTSTSSNTTASNPTINNPISYWIVIGIVLITLMGIVYFRKSNSKSINPDYNTGSRNISRDTIDTTDIHITDRLDRDILPKSPPKARSLETIYYTCSESSINLD